MGKFLFYIITNPKFYLKMKKEEMLYRKPAAKVVEVEMRSNMLDNGSPQSEGGNMPLDPNDDEG